MVFLVLLWTASEKHDELTRRRFLGQGKATGKKTPSSFQKPGAGWKDHPGAKKIPQGQSKWKIEIPAEFEAIPREKPKAGWTAQRIEKLLRTRKQVHGSTPLGWFLLKNWFWKPVLKPRKRRIPPFWMEPIGSSSAEILKAGDSAPQGKRFDVVWKSANFRWR